MLLGFSDGGVRFNIHETCSAAQKQMLLCFLGWSISVCLLYHIENLCMSSGSHILSSKLFSKATDKNFKNIQRIRPLGHHPIDINISGKDNYPLVMTNSLTWYRWPIEIYGLPSYKMGGSFPGYLK